jgi:hypothetical protein
VGLIKQKLITGTGGNLGKGHKWVSA